MSADKQNTYCTLPQATTLETRQLKGQRLKPFSEMATRFNQSFPAENGKLLVDLVKALFMSNFTVFVPEFSKCRFLSYIVTKILAL